MNNEIDISKLDKAAVLAALYNRSQPYFLEHDEWAKPFIAGFYAKKYECRLIDKAEATTRLDELLAYERRV